MALTVNQVNAHLRALVTQFEPSRALTQKAVAYIRAGGTAQERTDRKEAMQKMLVDMLSDYTAHQRTHWVRQYLTDEEAGELE